MFRHNSSFNSLGVNVPAVLTPQSAHRVYETAVLIEGGKLNDHTAVRQLLEIAALMGDLDARVRLGTDLIDTASSEEMLAEGLRWIRSAVACRHAGAQCMLGKMHFGGTGVERHYGKAFHLFILSSRQKNPDACYMMGVCYEQGKGPAANGLEAKAWYEKAAEFGHEQARIDRALLVCYGADGVPGDSGKGLQMLDELAEEGNPQAMSLVLNPDLDAY